MANTRVLSAATSQPPKADNGSTDVDPNVARLAVLHQRARAVAKKPVSTQNQALIEVVEFLIGRENYAFELDHLREVCPLSDVTYIPCSPKFLVGVINLRGQIIPILDLASFLGISQARIKVFNKAIILHKDGQVIGCLADEVIGARKIPLASVQQSLTCADAAGSEYLKGITTERLIVLDAVKILTDSRITSQTP